MGTWVVVLTFLAVGLFAFGVAEITFSEERQVKKVLGQLSGYEAEEAEEAQPALKPFWERALVPIVRWAARLVTEWGPWGLRDRVRRQLAAAGAPLGLDVEKTVLIKLLAGLGGGVCGLGLVLFRVVAPGPGLLLAPAMALVAFMIPDLWLAAKGSKRRKDVRRSLPDMLDMITISVEAGLGFDAALAKIIRNGRGPLAEEFSMMLGEVQAGLARRDALKNMSARVDVPELTSFVLSIMQAEVFGVSVKDILRTQSRELRVKRRQRAEELAQKAPVKLVFPVVLCVLPATLLVIAGPAIIAVSRTFDYMGV
jgi:tight adherence protein C